MDKLYEILSSDYFFLNTALTHANTCVDFYESPIIRETLKVIYESRLVWATFDPKTFNIVLTDSKTYPKCLLVISSGNLTELSLNKNIVIQNEAYTFIPSWSEKSEAELLLNSKGIKKVLILSTHNFLTDIELQNYPAKQLGLIVTTLFHEMFHHFGQVSIMGWPKWVYDFASYGRKDFSRDYHGHEIQTLNRERDFLIEALSNVDDKSVFIKNIKNFIKEREERYKRNPNCVDKEHAFKMLEGVAEYVGNETALSQKIFSHANLYRYIKYNTNNSLIPIPWY